MKHLKIEEYLFNKNIKRIPITHPKAGQATKHQGLIYRTYKKLKTKDNSINTIVHDAWSTADCRDLLSWSNASLEYSEAFIKERWIWTTKGSSRAWPSFLPNRPFLYLPYLLVCKGKVGMYAADLRQCFLISCPVLLFMKPPSVLCNVEQKNYLEHSRGEKLIPKLPTSL